MEKVDISKLEQLLVEVRKREFSETNAKLIEQIIILTMNVYVALNEKKVSIQKVKKIFFDDKNAKNKQDTKILNKKETINKAIEEQTKKNKKTIKGHGRNSTEEYKGAKKVYIKHDELKVGGKCPDKGCLGHLQNYYRKAKFVRLEGQAPIGATIYEQEILRCSACQYCYTAKLPKEVPAEKYSPTADAMIAISRYNYAIPNNRLAKLQKDLEIPLPASVQWERIEQVCNILLPLFLYLQIIAAQGEILYHDDTKVRILRALPSKNDKRTGLYTTGMVIETQGQKIALYKSGRNHAGENASELLSKRNPDLEPIKKMSDGSKNNNSPKIPAIIMLCLAHARGKFKEIAEIFPSSCQLIIKLIGLIYDNDEQTKNMNKQDRLAYHQEKSIPLLEAIKNKIKQDFQNKQVEPNDALGQAYKYLENNWYELTQFTRILGAPLDNNIVERILRLAVLQRKNSLFYRNDLGAMCADIANSIIETAILNKLNPYSYLVNLIENASALRAKPENFLPWNFLQSQSP